MADKPIIRWKPVAQTDPSDRTHTLYVPHIVERNQTSSLEDVVYRAIDRGLIAGLKTSAAEAIATGVLRQLGEELNAARGVDFGDFFKVRAYLDGTVEGLLGHLTAENKLNTRFLAGKELKLSRDAFSFRNVLETGDLPYIDDVQGVYAEAGQVRIGEPVQLVGSMLKLGSGDRIEIYKVEDDGSLTVTGTVTSAGLSQNTDLVVAFSAGSAFDGLPEGQKVAFKVVKTVQVEDATETVMSNVATATLLNP
jgi:hypothetical protein